MRLGETRGQLHPNDLVDLGTPVATDWQYKCGSTGHRTLETVKQTSVLGSAKWQIIFGNCSAHRVSPWAGGHSELFGHLLRKCWKNMIPKMAASPVLTENLLFLFSEQNIKYLMGEKNKKPFYLNQIQVNRHPWAGDVLLTLSQPFGHEVRGGHGEEGGVVGLGGHSLGQIRLPRSRRAEQQDAPPWSAFAWEHKVKRSVGRMRSHYRAGFSCLFQQYSTNNQAEATMVFTAALLQSKDRFPFTWIWVSRTIKKKEPETICCLCCVTNNAYWTFLASKNL